MKFLGQMAWVSSALVAIAKQLSKGSLSLFSTFTCSVEESCCSTFSSTLSVEHLYHFHLFGEYVVILLCRCTSLMNNEVESFFPVFTDPL